VFWDSPGGGDTDHPQLRASDFVSISDARLKSRVEPIAGALQSVVQLQGIKFDWDGSKTDPAAGPDARHDARRHVGFAAQEVARVIPEVVSHEPNTDVYGVSYGGIVPYLVEAIKEQQTQIAALQSQLAAIQARLEAVEARR
jgi:hypothetical protein